MKKILLVLAVLFALTGCTDSDEQVINVYTSRHYDVDQEIYEMFEEETGITLNVLELESPELMTKVANEGNQVADVLFLSGAEYLYNLNELGILNDLSEDITSISTYSGSNWVGITGRTRSVALSNDSDLEVTSYMDLLKPEFNEQILVRSSSNSYNQALVAGMIDVHGEEYATEFVQGLVNNFARTPEGNDRDQVKSVNAGLGEVAIVNSYYLNRLKTSTDASEVSAAEAVNLQTLDEMFLNLSVMVSISDNELNDELIKFYLRDDIQQKIADENGEYPLVDGVEGNEYINSLQTVNPMDIDYLNFGQYIEDAYEIMLDNGWL